MTAGMAGDMHETPKGIVRVVEINKYTRDKPEITNYKHHLILKLGQINSKLQYPNLK
jgi:hypothetical protein